MAAPLILISSSNHLRGAEFADASLSLSHAYPEAIAAVGGLPWIMPNSTSEELIAESVRRCDGVLLTGGDDVQPSLYQARLSPRLRKTLGPPDPPRDVSELSLIREVFRQRKPLLAICRGQQILNVALGGSLLVDIASQVPGASNHCRMDKKNEVVHDLAVAEDSLLAKVLGPGPFRVNSTHHQAVRQPARPFRVTGRSPDGVIEAMELGLAEQRLLPYLLAVQFHPERLIKRHAGFLELFGSFTRACRSERNKSI
jgi:putative glutamine amidotransferase